MTTDEFRTILDRFHKHFSDAGDWAFLRDPNMEDTPPWYDGFDAVWRDLNRHCGLMKDAERRIVTTRPPPPPPPPPPNETMTKGEAPYPSPM